MYVQCAGHAVLHHRHLDHTSGSDAADYAAAKCKDRWWWHYNNGVTMTWIIISTRRSAIMIKVSTIIT